MQVRRAEGDERDWALAWLREQWVEPVLGRGQAWPLEACRLWIAGDRQGVAAVSDQDRPIAELVAINAAARLHGAGTALVEALKRELPREGFTTLRLLTTNDNVDALRFYQRRGFRLAAVRPGAVEGSRRIKPALPLIGNYGIPIRDELDLELDLRG
jgi:GNAT superfamily N-acetyltransferase